MALGALGAVVASLGDLGTVVAHGYLSDEGTARADRVHHMSEARRILSDCLGKHRARERANEERARKQQEERQKNREYAAELADLRAGRFCSQCGNSATQIERGGTQTFAEHLRNVRGTAQPATQEMFDNLDRRYRELLDPIRERIRLLDRTIVENDTFLCSADISHNVSQWASASGQEAGFRVQRQLEEDREHHRALAEVQATITSLTSGPLDAQMFAIVESLRAEDRGRRERRDAARRSIDESNVRWTASVQSDGEAIRSASMPLYHFPLWFWFTRPEVRWYLVSHPPERSTEELEFMSRMRLDGVPEGELRSYLQACLETTAPTGCN